jgi:hypothetical protein
MGEISSELPYKFNKLIRDYKSDSNTIVIYPDCIVGNPLNAKKVVRYLMSKPYILNGNPLNCDAKDFLIAYSNAVSTKLPQYNILLSNIDLKFLKSIKRKNKVCIYYGKIRVNCEFTNIKYILNNFSEIYVVSRSFPDSKDILYKNIAESKLFITLDPLTHLAFESTLLGTPVFFADNIFESLYNDYNYKLHGFYYTDSLNINKIINYDHNSLMQNSAEIFHNENQKNNQKTQDIIKEIEAFINSGNKNNLIQEINNDDKNFYSLNWGFSPIFNCSTERSVILFHIYNRFFILYLLIKCIKLLIFLIKDFIYIRFKNYVLSKIDQSSIELIYFKLFNSGFKKKKEKLLFISKSNYSPDECKKDYNIIIDEKNTYLSSKLIKLLWF